MSSAASEHLALLASFAEEIEPLLSMLAGAIDSLAERPDDSTAVMSGKAQIQTLRGAASLLELPGFLALLDLMAEAIDVLSTAPRLGSDGRAAATELAALLEAQRNALARGNVAPVAPPAAP